MDKIQDLYTKKFQLIQESYEKICGKISTEYSLKRVTIEEEKAAALAPITYAMYQSNPDAYNSAVNAVYKAYGDKLTKLQEDYNLEMKRISIVHESNKRQLNTAFNGATQDYIRTTEALNNASSENLERFAQAALDSISPALPRITTITSAR